MIIDFHTHTFPDKISEKVVHNLGNISHTIPFTNGSVADLARSMKKASIDYSVSLPVMTTPVQTEKVNHATLAQKEALEAQGILPFGGIHPDYENYKEILTLLAQNGIKGIKIHPAYQGTDLDDLKMMRIISFASDLDLIVVTHAGIDIGILDHNYASVKMSLKVIEEVRPPKFVLAHMGGWDCWQEVESDLCGAPVYFDTAFSLGKITPYPGTAQAPYRQYNLSERDFTRIIRKHGTEKVLFATDSPWEDQTDYVSRLEDTTLTRTEKDAILYQNGARLLQL